MLLSNGPRLPNHRIYLLAKVPPCLGLQIKAH